ncbi:LAFE_0B11848g1_1 [Lachancea fermentati]|uniref:LAFE_0B11848g1_1 n=1 Tax=Lachancea fermentati TaxID=4955 RepID=A0A1G4M925_LACFM|nr:LAFE_0B11848g1_1 [Lachancea fermentati]
MNDDLVENTLSFASAPRVALKVKNLSVLTDKDNIIVHNVSMKVPSGSLIAIIGGSGSGKTTLLNVLANKVAKGLKYTGEYKIVPESDSPTSFVTTAYLTQHDILSPKLTCREILQYAADLKSTSSKAEKCQLVEELIAELGLKDCADTYVGDPNHPGLSGGEKRRLSIGIQMISNPSLMFLDEPTTGLDAYSAYLAIKTLRKLSHKAGKTFIMSIHQPRADILFLLDQICILSKGYNVFCSSVSKMVPYFHNLGYDVPEHVNPADFFIDLCSVDTRTTNTTKQTEERLQLLKQSWQSYEKNLDFTIEDTEKDIKLSSPSVPFWSQVKVLTARSIKLNLRDTVTFVGVLLEPVVIGTIAGWIYYKPDKTTLSGIRTVSGALYSSGALQGYLFQLFETYRLCEKDIKVYDRERSEGSVTPLAFFVSRRIANFLLEDFAVPFIFSIITFFMYGLNVNARSFFIYFSVVLLVHQTSTSLAMLSVSISRDFSQASLIGNLTYTLQSMASGFFVNAKKMPVYVRWTKYIAFIWYSFGCLMSNQFTDFACNLEGQEGCYGNMLLDSFGYSRNWITVPIIAVFCWGIGFYIFSIFFLYWKRVDVSMATKVKSRKKAELGTKDENIDVESFNLETPRCGEIPITIEISGLTLRLEKLDFLSTNAHKFGNHQTKCILSQIDAVFKPNMINAIMGPSGSGKSSLLNLISGRLNSTLFKTFHTEGTISFNGLTISRNKFRDVCSFVPQDDDHLLAKLTVRETLSYAAELRLHHLSSSERSLRIDELISELGLKHCENHLVGDELSKGISGGEKRRVSMGIQLLTDPPILLLDEPTSGLDSFTSFKILDVLNKICQKPGRTVILTIHQPRAELFEDFGNVLLLAKGGNIAFNGSPLEMMKYFSGLGYYCPPLTNVADFFLDLISINTQNDENEEISSKRVTKLLENWRVRQKENAKVSEKSMTQEKLIEFLDINSTSKAGFGVAYKVTVRRQFKTMRRSMDSLIARLAQIPGLGIILALFFAPIKHDYTSVSNRLGLVQESTALYYTGMLTNLACYPSERDYFYGEFNDNVYGVAPFYLGYMTIELPMALAGSALYAIFIVLVCGLNRTAGNFFATLYCTLIIVTCGEALGIITNTLFQQPGFVVNIVSIVLSIGTVMSGLMSLQMSRVLKGINYISPMNYTSMIMINMAFPDDLRLTCKDGGQTTDGSCTFSTGRDVLETFGLVKSVRIYLGVIICVWFIYRLIAYLILKAKLEWFRK